MKAVIKFFVYMALITVVMYLSGCNDYANNIQGNSEKLNIIAKQAPEQKYPDSPDNSKETTDTGNITVANGQKNKTNNTSASKTASYIVSTVTGRDENTTLVLYFSDTNGYLQAERRNVTKTPGIARQAIYELCRGPQNKSLATTLPEGTRLLDINIKDGLCTVNFSRELVAKHSGGSGAENTTVYSIVNTLTQFSSINQVQILVEGHVVDSIAGHLDVSAPLTRDDEIIRAGTG